MAGGPRVQHGSSTRIPWMERMAAPTPRPTGPAPAREPAGRPAAGAVQKGRAWVRKVRSPPRRVPPERLEMALQARKSRALALAVLLFVLGFSLDDLRVLRVPGYLVGLGGALLAIAVGPLLMARRLALDHLDEPVQEFQVRCARVRRLGALALVGALAGLVVWLVYFSSGVPPWAQ